MSEKCQVRTLRLFDHLVGAGQQSRRHRETDSSSRLEIDAELHFCGLLDRKLA